MRAHHTEQIRQRNHDLYFSILQKDYLKNIYGSHFGELKDKGALIRKCSQMVSCCAQKNRGDCGATYLTNLQENWRIRRSLAAIKQMSREPVQIFNAIASKPPPCLFLLWHYLLTSLPATSKQPKRESEGEHARCQALFEYQCEMIACKHTCSTKKKILTLPAPPPTSSPS